MFLAVDVGGTKMAVALVSGAGEVCWSARTATPRGGSGERVWEALQGLLVEAIGAAGESRPLWCGVGCGGPMAEGGLTVSPLNIPCWREFPLLRRLEEATGLGVTIDNDAKALALGEAWRGAASGQRNFMSMVVSTGIGGGIVLDGRLLDGAQGNAGHVGHLIVVPGGRRCECGARGCLEAEASGTAIAALTGAPAADAPSEWVDRTGRLVGRGVGMVANLLDLDLVTVAGSVALGFGEPFFRAASEELGRVSQLHFSRSCRIIPSPLGADGPLIGAAAVARRAVG